MVARRQLLGLGLREDAIDSRLRAGGCTGCIAGVYAVGHRLVSREGRWMAAVLGVGDGAVLSHRSAAALWGDPRDSASAIEVTSPRDDALRGAIRRHRRALPADEVTVERRIPVTTRAADALRPRRGARPIGVERAMREAEYRGSRPALARDLLGRYPRRRGVRGLRTCLERLAEAPAGVTRSARGRFLPFLDRTGLPRPQLNAWLELGGERSRSTAAGASSG